MILGIDPSAYFETVELGAKYYMDGKRVDPLDEFRRNGVSAMRIRVWVDPYGENGEKYLGGTCDLDNFIKLGALATKKGYDILLDFHYSDFWADPAKQFIPKAWKNKTPDELAEAVYDHTAEVLRAAEREKINVKYIQVGNEITNGMLWDVGKLTGGEGKIRDNYDMLCRLLKSGISACRKECPSAEVMLHLERSHDQAVYNEFFGQMEEHGVDYDIIGMSYYPHWHGTLDQYFANVENIKKFGKKIMTVELGYAFTDADYLKEAHDGAELVFQAGNIAESGFTAEYPISPEGQAKFTETFLTRAKKAGIAGVFWWEPVWIPAGGTCWSSEAGLEYSHEEGKHTRNDWANQCLFDYDGNALPAFKKFKK